MASETEITEPIITEPETNGGTLVTEEADDIKQLNLDIRTESELARNLGVQAYSFAESALKHVVRCGELLNKAKKTLNYEGFGKWIEENFEFNDKTARSWMKLSTKNKANDIDFDNPKHGELKQVYMALGMLPEPDRKAGDGTNPWKGTPLFKLNFRIIKPVEEWSDYEKKDFLNKIEPLIMVYRKLT
jgi:hypothetical protein